MMVTGTKELVLEGLKCAACAAKIEEKIKALDGVTDVSVNFTTKKLTLETKRLEDLERVIQEVRGIIRLLEPDVVLTEKRVDFKQQKAFLLMGLDCANCATKIEEQVMKIPGISSALVNFPAKKLMVEVKSGINNGSILEHIKEKVNRIEPGVEVRPVGEEKVLSREEEKHGEKLETIRLAIGASTVYSCPDI